MKPLKFLSKFLLLFFYLIVFGSINLFSQKAVNVDLLTGVANVTIPVYMIQRGDISIPIVYYYRASGIRVEDYDQRFGLGWRLSLEAGITRNLRGFPDDVIYQANAGYSSVYGWLRSGATNIPGKVENFSIAGGVTSGTCANEVSDYSYMNSNLPYNYDTEPDIFDVNAPGLSLQFVFDKTGTIRTIPYQDVKITMNPDQYGAINSFTVVNDRGVKYVFDKKNYCTFSVDYGVNGQTLPAFSRDYLFYHTYTTNDVYLTYTNKWCLTSITDTKGTQVVYNYDVVTPGTAPVSNEKVEILKYNPSTQQYDKNYLYTKHKNIQVERLHNIVAYSPDGVYGAQGDIQFTWADNTAESQLTEIDLIWEGKKILPAYTIKFSGNGNTNSWGRTFLAGISINGIGITGASQYQFLYQSVDDVARTSYCTFTGNDSITYDQDYWGYFTGHNSNPNLNPQIWVYPDNPAVHMFRINQIPNYITTYPNYHEVSLAGANRTVSSNVTAGTLTQITYPTGGTTTLTYDNQEYFDNDVNAAVWGGGVRIRQITNNDRISGTNETTYYDYNDPVTGVTTGKPTAVPTFAFAFPNSTTYSTVDDKVKNSTYRTLYNFSDESAYIIYGKVTVRKTTGGKSVYGFNTEATWGASSGNDWSETMGYATRNYTSNPNPCNNIAPDFLKNDKNAYPFPANPNFEFQRGLLNSITNYDESGNKVSEEFYTYQRSHTTSSPVNPMTIVQALKFDDISSGSVRRYAKYNVLSSVTNLLQQKVTNIYNGSSYITETEAYTYPTVDHRLPITVSKTNSDGTTYKTYLSYVKDFQNLSSGGDVYNQAIYTMLGLNINSLIESYQTVTPPSSSEAVIGASLILPKTFVESVSGLNLYLPYETYKFSSTAGVTLTGNFPSTIVSSNFQKYSGYVKTATVNDYDFGGMPTSVTNNLSRVNGGAIHDIDNGDLLIAEFQNAKNTEVLYGSFDYNNPVTSFQGYTTANLASPGRASKSCLLLNTGASIYQTVNNATTNTNMIFSCWIKGAASAGTVTVNLSATGLNSNYTLSFAATTDWKYYEIIIPKPSNASYTVTVSTSVAIKIDDILFYPGNASIKTYSYDQKTYVNTSTGLSSIVLTAETGLGGATKTYEYDTYGRLYLIRDGFNNIIELKAYKQVNNWQNLGTDSILWSTPVPNNLPTTYIASLATSPPAGEVISYTWDFGDGTPLVTSSTPYQLHTYTVTGTYQATCTIYSSALGTITAQTPPTNSTNPPPITVIRQNVVPIICAAGITEETTDGQCVLSSCTGLTAVCTNTKFKLTDIMFGSLANVQSQIWEKADLGSNSWTQVNAPLGVATVNFTTSFPWTRSYRMRCRVTMTNGDQGTSAEIYVYNNYNQ
jgi:hypothetical protein